MKPERVYRIRRIWLWFYDEKNRKALGFIAVGIAAVVGAGWQVYTHFSKPQVEVPKFNIVFRGQSLLP